VRNVSKITEKFPKSELYGLTNQMRRAAVSIPSNISEGASRNSAIERRRFYEISRFSLVELDTQIEIAIRLKYISEETIPELNEKINHLFALLSNLIKNTIWVFFHVSRLTFDFSRFTFDVTKKKAQPWYDQKKAYCQNSQ